MQENVADVHCKIVLAWAVKLQPYLTFLAASIPIELHLGCPKLTG